MPELLRNGRIHAPSVTRTGRLATAMLVDGDTVVWIGDEDGAAGYADTEPVVDLAGDVVTAAFVDAHVHTTDTGLATTALDLRGAGSVRDVLDAVERAARANGGRPILGGGWNESDWPEHRPPTSAELDRAAYGGIVYLARVDIHSAVVSSSLLAAVPGATGLAGYRGDGWVGEPDAHDPVRRAALFALTRGQRADAQRAALQQAASLGIASVHEMAGPSISNEDDLMALLAMSAVGDVPEVIGYWGELFGTDRARELGAVGAAGDLFCDGSLGSGTAALHESYADRNSTGWVRYDVDALAAHIESCVAAGMQSGFHAIGDAAVDQVVAAYELASARLGRSVGPGNRIEHAEYVRDPQRLANSGLLASMQPVFDALWGGVDGMYAERLGLTADGGHRALALNRCGELAASGVPLAFGSDSPVTELGAWGAVRAAATHHDPAASLPVEAGFAAHSRGGWLAAGRPDEGMLAVGAPATYAVWSAPELPVLASGLPDVAAPGPLPQCRRTVLRGRTIHAGQGA